MKTPKTYRLHPSTIQELEWLKTRPFFKDYTETDIIEAAITELLVRHKHAERIEQGREELV